MPKYFVRPHEFLDALPKEHSMYLWLERCIPVMRQLVARYGLEGKTVMAVGPGGAIEEIAMLELGVKRLLLFDIDERGKLAPILRSLNRHPDEAPITYVIGDFTQPREAGDELPPADVLYMSGFTPDEQRRGAISAQWTQQIQERWAKGEDTKGADPNWPPDMCTLHESVCRAIDVYLRPGGWLIIQSIGYGVDVVSNPGYVAAWRQTLAAQGATLLEGYCFTAAPGVTLWVGVKGAQSADALRAELGTRPALRRFHYRAQLPDGSITRFI